MRWRVVLQFIARARAAALLQVGFFDLKSSQAIRLLGKEANH
jgi:hypothetical protein